MGGGSTKTFFSNTAFGIEPLDDLVGEDALELPGDDALDDGVEDGVEVEGGEISDHKKKLAELVSDDSANCRFCCSRNFFLSDWNASRRDVLAPPPVVGSNDNLVGAGRLCLFWNVCTNPFVVIPVHPDKFNAVNDGDLRTR